MNDLFGPFYNGGKMENLIGQLTASLIEKESSLPDGLIKKINNNVHPPEKVTAGDIYIRAMYIVSDQVNSYGGRFPADEHDRLAELLIDCPVLVGHRKDSLPIARTFFAEKEQRDDSNWVKVYFYWLKNSTKGDDLRENIDGGIYKECSISFIFSFPECSICGTDIRECRHRPLSEYKNSNGEMVAACFNYRQIEKVLEASLVYRGSVHDTSITRELFVPIKQDEQVIEKRERPKIPPHKRLWDLSRLDNKQMYFVLPAYESLRLLLQSGNNEFKILSYDGQNIDSIPLETLLKNGSFPAGEYIADCRLIGYRGKERQPVAELLEFLEGSSSTVRRMEIKVADLMSLNGEKLSRESASIRREKLEKLFESKSKLLLPIRPVAGDELLNSVTDVATRYGVEIYDCESYQRYIYTHRKLVSLIVSAKRKQGRGFNYVLNVSDDVENQTIECALNLKKQLEINDSVELEVGAINCDKNKVKLIHPRIFDSYGIFGQPDDLSLLMENTPSTSENQRYVACRIENDNLLLNIDKEICFKIRKFSQQALDSGHGFVIEPSGDTHGTIPPIGKGTIISREIKSGSTLYKMAGFLNGEFILRPIRLNNRNRLMFCRYPAGCEG